MNDALVQGKFRGFGLSNYSAAEVYRFLEICEEHGYAKPSVYEGHYNAIARGCEKELFPLLRKHGMSFYCYRYVGGSRHSKPSLMQYQSRRRRSILGTL